MSRKIVLSVSLLLLWFSSPENILSFSSGSAGSSSMQRLVVVLHKPIKSQTLGGIIRVANSDSIPLSGVTVELRSKGWKTILETTLTDANGRFIFSQITKKGTYYLLLSKPEYNSIQLKVKLTSKKNTPKELNLPMANSE